jgi:Winged helix DNA-binding domain
VTPAAAGAPLARRLTAQLLSGPPAPDSLAVAERLLAIQAQDPRGARLAIRTRTSGGSAADVDRELSDRRSLLITWLNRGTLHLIRSEDYAWLHALTTPPLHTSNLTRLAQEGIDAVGAERGVAVIERALINEGPLTRHELRERLRSAGLPVHGQGFIHLLYRAALQGISVRGPKIGAEHAYVLVRDWLPAPPPRPVPRERALAELARRYLAGHGPASDRDLARWAGLPLRDARAGLQSIAPALDRRPGGLVDLAGRPRAARLPPPRLLGAFEPLLMGWSSRADVLGDHETAIVSGGIFRGFALAGGRAVARWRFAGRDIVIEPFGVLSAADAAALETDAVALRRYLGS